MSKKYCTNCNLVLNSDVKFCPECGGPANVMKKQKSVKQNINFKFDKKKLIIIACVVVGLIIVGIVAFSVIQNIVLKNNADNAKSTITSKANIDAKSETIGNFAGNITSEALSVANDDTLYFAFDNGIYMSSKLDTKEIDIASSKKIADGKFKSLNYFDNQLICIKTDDNSIYKLTDTNNEDKQPYIDKLYTSDPGFMLESVAINSDNVYTLSSNSGKFFITSTNLRSKNKINDVWNGEGNKAWMNVNESTIKICVSSSNGWNAYRGDIDGNKTTGLKQYCSGSGNPVSVAFYEDKVYALNAVSSSGNSSITIYEAGGNRNDINLDCSAKKLLLSGQTIFIQCNNDRFIWFNIDTNMSHDIDNHSFKDVDVKTINVNNGKFCVLYADNSVVLSDIASLN